MPFVAKVNILFAHLESNNLISPEDNLVNCSDYLVECSDDLVKCSDV